MKTRSTLMAFAAALFAINATASGTPAGGHAHDESPIGEAGLAANVSRSVQVDMLDTMRFTPARLSVKQGETIRFTVTNTGKIKHEFVLGTAKDLKEHDEMMKKNPEMVHVDANMLSLAPGQTGEVIWQFSQAGAVNIGCFQPGHYAAGMAGLITVAPDKGVTKRVKKVVIKEAHHEHEHEH